MSSRSKISRGGGGGDDPKRGADIDHLAITFLKLHWISVTYRCQKKTTMTGLSKAGSEDQLYNFFQIAQNVLNFMQFLEILEKLYVGHPYRARNSGSSPGYCFMRPRS